MNLVFVGVGVVCYVGVVCCISIVCGVVGLVVLFVCFGVGV